IFGAVQAIQVAGAEHHVIAHFDRLNETRRQAVIKDRLVSELLYAVFTNTIGVGTGLILLLATQSMQAGTFTVGDFALFVYYLGYVTWFPQLLGGFAANYKQTGVSVERLTALLQGASPAALVEHAPLHLN